MSIGGQRRLGRTLGRLAWWLRSPPAKVTLTNLGSCYPDLDDTRLRCLARLSLEHTGSLLCESGIVFHWPESRWRPLVTSLEGEALIESAHASGQGVLILVPHIGNWEFLGLILGRHRVTALYDPPRNRFIEPLVRGSRSRTGATLLPIGAAGLRSLYRVLKQGGVTALLPDQVPDREAGVYVPFFGVPALTMTLAQRLVRGTGARPLLGCALRCRDGFRIVFSSLPETVADPDPAVAAAAMNAAIEVLVRQAPEQYQWEYKRFKGQPRDQRSLYARRR